MPYFRVNTLNGGSMLTSIAYAAAGAPGGVTTDGAGEIGRASCRERV